MARIIEAEVINVEVVNETKAFPQGDFVAEIIDPEEAVFDYFLGDDVNIENWKQVMVGTNEITHNPVYINDGFIFLYNTSNSRIINTGDSVVKNAEDLRFWNDHHAAYISSEKGLLC